MKKILKETENFPAKHEDFLSENGNFKELFSPLIQATTKLLIFGFL